MLQTVDEEIDLTDITRNNSPLTLISITKARIDNLARNKSKRGRPRRLF
jgi:hypothetical protein